MRLPHWFLLLALLFVGGGPALAQTSPASSASGAQARPTYVVNKITVDGVDDERTRRFVVQSSGLTTGQRVTIPSGDAIAQAIRSIYELRMFSDVSIHRETLQGNRVNLTIEVTSEPTLAQYSLEGIKDSDREDLREQIPLIRGRSVRDSDVERARQIIQNFYEEEGYLRTEVAVNREAPSDGRVRIVFDVNRHEEVEVQRIRFSGNDTFDGGDLRGAMEKTRENRWWRIWKGEQFKRNEYEEDLNRVVDFYRAKGYYDAQVVQDSVYYISNEGLGVDVTVREGQKYYVSDIEWQGNTIFPDRALTQQLGLEEGAVYNGKALDENLYGNQRGTDVMGMYMDRGYMRADVQPTVRVAGEDSLDITFDVQEGDVYSFGEVNVTGNTKTKDYVIRRELYTVPGSRFSRSAIKESIRRLNQLSYFSKQSIAGGPDVSVDQQEKEANLTYDVEEVGSDQLQLSGTFGRFGLVLQLGFQFNNFSAQNLFDASAWRPIPSGDGQKLSINVRTNGTFYQNYSLSFTEPWFRGSPTPVGGSVSYSKYTRSIYGRGATSVQGGSFQNIQGNLFVRQRLDWPDDKFQVGTNVGYRLYNNQGTVQTDDGREEVGLFRSVPTGVNQSVTIRQSLTRNSLDNPRFPRRGSEVKLSVEVAPPVSDFVQYHKWRLNSKWNVPIGENFSFGVGTDFGYIGSITGDLVQFERFEVGGTPFDYNGVNYGTDPVYMRGYPRGVIGPLQEGQATGGLQPQGGRVLNKYTSEFRWKAVESRQLQARPYLFLDAAGAWNSLDSYNPSNLYRSAGLGVKLYLPIVGMIEFNYGYNFDAYTPLERGADGTPNWTFQFSLGQGFGGGGGRGGGR